MSLELATRNLRKFSAWRVSVDGRASSESLVTPSTSRATSAPNRRSISSSVATVSSTVSWSSPVTIDAASSLSSERMPATSTGWEK